MTELVAVNSKTHRNLRIAVDRARRETDLGYVLGVVPREFARLVGHYPIFFAKSPDSGQFEPVILLGFDHGENLFIAGGIWDVAYVPLQVQRQPFGLFPRRDDSTGGAESLELAIDVSRPFVQTDEGERLFGDDGAATPYLQTIGSIMQALVSGLREAHAFTAKLEQLHLLEPVRIEIKFADGSDSKLDGLHWIAANALKAVQPRALAELRDKGYLEWLYFQIASLAHVPALVTRKNAKLTAATAANPSGLVSAGS